MHVLTGRTVAFERTGKKMEAVGWQVKVSRRLELAENLR
jgi:hypothetical protein